MTITQDCVCQIQIQISSLKLASPAVTLIAIPPGSQSSQSERLQVQVCLPQQPILQTSGHDGCLHHLLLEGENQCPQTHQPLSGSHNAAWTTVNTLTNSSKLVNKYRYWYQLVYRAAAFLPETPGRRVQLQLEAMRLPLWNLACSMQLRYTTLSVQVAPQGSQH